MEQLAAVFEREAKALRSSASTVDLQLRRSFWRGPDADRFISSWNRRDLAALRHVADQLAELARDVRKQADQQVQASSGTNVGALMTPRSEHGPRDQPPPRFMWSSSWGGGKKLGPLIEYLPEYEINSDYYQQVDSEGKFHTRANSSVFVANKWGVDLGDLDAVVAVASGGTAALAKLAGDSLLGGPTVDGSLSAGDAVEYKWYDNSSLDGNSIYNHYSGKSTSTMNRFFGKFGLDDVRASIDNNEVPPPDSVVMWKSIDAMLDVKSSQGLLPKAGVGISSSLLYGSECFENGDSAKIVRASTFGSVYADGEVVKLDPGLHITKFEGELGASLERRLVYDSDGNPRSLEITDEVRASVEGEEGVFVVEGHQEGSSLVTKYTFDLTDPEVIARLDLRGNDDILPLSARALENTELALGERYSVGTDTSSVNVDYLWTVGMNESGGTSTAGELRIKPVGSSEFVAWSSE